MPNDNEAIMARLDEISKKLDYVVERQRWTEELVEEMTPIARLAMGSATDQLAGLDELGAFDKFAILRGAFTQVLKSYTKEDVQHLADAAVGILDTVRRVTQPEVLKLANDATDILSHPEDAHPVGMFGAMRRASRDEDIQRGMGLALELMRKIGRAGAAAAETPRARLTSGTPKVAPAAAPNQCAPASKPEADVEVVEWEGHAFDTKGFLIDANTWNTELASKIAEGLGITLTDEHWIVIEWVRADYALAGASPNVRRIATGSGVGTETMYRLFPPTPGKTCAMIAGVPKPVGCV